MNKNMKYTRATVNNYATQLLLICVLLFGAFHVSYQHDDLISSGVNHEQGCEYCSSVGPAIALPTTDLYPDLLTLSSIHNPFYNFILQNSNFYHLQNPRAPPL